jgi:hypothetical protein
MVYTNKSYTLEGIQCLKRQKHHHRPPLGSADYPSSLVSVMDVYA